jgi:uncharacterized protein (TIGR02145 family)
MSIQIFKNTLVKTIFFCFILVLNSCEKPTKESPLPVIIPTITIGQVTSITFNAAKVGAQITSTGNGTITERGFVYDISPQVTFNNTKVIAPPGSDEFQVEITGLKPSMKYYIKAFATNSAGTTFSNELSFTTSITLPTLATKQVSNIGTTSALSGGDITEDGGSAITSRGICWSTKQNPTIADSKTQDGLGTGTFNSNLTNLTNGTVYYIRAFATNAAGTAYGNQVEFKTLEEQVLNSNLAYGTLIDIDGNTYASIKIGTQTWMAQDLKVSRYNNGDPVINVSDGVAWSNLKSGAYAYYNNDSTLKDILSPSKSYYGKWYNWYAVVDNRKLCPVGWHVPSNNEWTTLINFLGGQFSAGGKVRSVNSLWKSPNLGADNQSGFSSLPGGLRVESGIFSGMGSFVFYWSSTEISSSSAATVLTTYAVRELLFGNYSDLSPGYFKARGQSVRCIKD